MISTWSARPLLEECAEREVTVLAAAPFNSGLLSTPVPSATSTFDYAPVSAAVLAEARDLAAVCAEYDVPLPAAALQFPLLHPAVASVVVGLRSAAQVAEATDWLGRPIPEPFWADVMERGLR